MPSIIPLDNSLGAALIGTMISAIIYGITCLQIHLYYTKYSENDGRATKFLVGLLWVLDTLHMVLLTIMIYHYTVTNWGDLAVLSRTTWSLEIGIIVVTLVASIVQCFFARRIWYLSEKNWVLTGAIVFLSMFQLAFGNAFMWHTNRTQFFENAGSKTNEFLMGGYLCGDIACDIVISVSMCYYLHKSRTGFKGTNSMINMLITYTIRTCLLTTIFTVGCLVTFIVFPQTMIYCALYFIACRLYANSFLSILNSRESIAEKGRPQGSNLISLGSLRFGDSNTANEGNSTIVKGSSDGKWVTTGPHNQPHERSEFFDGSTKLPV